MQVLQVIKAPVLKILYHMMFTGSGFACWEIGTLQTAFKSMDMQKMCVSGSSFVCKQVLCLFWAKHLFIWTLSPPVTPIPSQPAQCTAG